MIFVGMVAILEFIEQHTTYKCVQKIVFQSEHAIGLFLKKSENTIIFIFIILHFSIKTLNFALAFGSPPLWIIP